MRVAVDEAGKDGGLREIDDCGSGRDLHAGAGRDGFDAFPFDGDDHVLADGVTGGVEEMSRKNVGGLWGWRRGARGR